MIEETMPTSQGCTSGASRDETHEVCEEEEEDYMTHI